MFCDKTEVNTWLEVNWVVTNRTACNDWYLIELLETHSKTWNYLILCQKWPQVCLKISLTKYVYGGARIVMVIVVGNGHGVSSSNPGRDWLHFT